MGNAINVPTSRSQELIKSIRILAINGKAAFKKYLYDPLYTNGWHLRSNTPTRKALERWRIESEDPSFLHTIAPRCKRIISAAIDEGLTSLGDASIFFLEKMQFHITISASPESRDFISIISQPLDEFMKQSSSQNEKLFTGALSSAQASEIKRAFEPVKLTDKNEKIRFDEEIKRLYEHILIASKYHNLPKCRTLLTNYIIKFSDAPDYCQENVEKLLAALNKREAGFQSDLMNAIAIELHYKITRGVLAGDIKTAIQGIRKYGYIFEGDTSAKYCYDIDKLERILYKMITDKGLWGDLKKEG